MIAVLYLFSPTAWVVLLLNELRHKLLRARHDHEDPAFPLGAS